MDKLTRRAALAGAALSTVALAAAAVPAVEVAEAEHPNVIVRRLSKDIAHALRDPAHIGFKRVTITPEWVIHDEDEQDASLIRLALEIMAIRTTWDERAAAHYAQHPGDINYDVCDQPEADLETAMCEQLKAIPARTLRGVCIKMLMDTGFGDFPLSSEIAEEAIQLAGFAPEPSHPRHPDYQRA